MDRIIIPKDTNSGFAELRDSNGIVDARVDTDRAKRNGYPEVILAEHKTAEQVVRIAEKILEDSGEVLITRVLQDQRKALHDLFAHADDLNLVDHPTARLVYIHAAHTFPRKRTGLVVVAAAGSSDLPVAEEAALCSEIFGGHVERIYDVGVAGVHRTLEHTGLLQKARVIIVVAGMEGALPSLVAGLVKVPVVAVPTSVGYGAHFEGITPLLAMMTSCAAGIGVVNIDNGFGAAVLASRINNPTHDCELNSLDSHS